VNRIEKQIKYVFVSGEERKAIGCGRADKKSSMCSEEKQ